MFYKRILVLSLSTFIFITGCHSPLYNQSVGNVGDVASRVKEEFKNSDMGGRAENTLVVKDGMYVDRTPISLAKQPRWLKNRILLRGDQLPFNYFSRTLASGGGQSVLTRNQVGLDEKAKVSMNYSGTVKAAKTGYVYSIDGNNIYWQAFITRTFDIAFMPGASDYLMGKSASTSSSSNASGGSGGSNATVTSGNQEDQQYSNLKANVSVWKDLETSLKELASPDGRVVVSQATTSVTVRDKPTNVDLIAKFVGNLNHSLSQQVLVKIQVLEVQLEHDFNYGIDWNIVGKAFGKTNYTLVANYGVPSSIRALTSGGDIPKFGLVGGSGTGVLINALKQQSRVAVVSEPRLVCLNNQVSTIALTNQRGYLASLQTTVVPGSSGGSNPSITSQVTPGILVTGLTLYVLPKILNNKVYMQISADLSNDLGLRSIGTNGGASAPAGGTVIEVPTFTQKRFNQRTVIESGDTLILSGFRRISNTANAMQLLDSQALGGKGAQQADSETVVLITPIILHGLG
jgi:type IVB pilus formation R64 PilN family outer membrane protein